MAIKRRRLQQLIAATLACAIAAGSPTLTVAQTAPPAPAQPAAPPPAVPENPPLTQEELDQLLAPIALYPDSLLTQMFMASTYPLEIVQAERWLKANETLKGDALAAALENQSWDPSVKSLINVPDVLALMNDQLDLTIKLGNAFLDQQADVLNTVQRLRSKANEAGNLKSNAQQTIVIEQTPSTVVVQQTAAPPQIITIESPNPSVIYVPAYNPVVVYGAWPYPTYVPYPYYPPRPPYYVATPGLYFGVGVACGVAWGYAWGRCSWGRSSVNININQNINYNRTINRNNYQANFNRNTNNIGGSGSWRHNPSHRQGVPYPSRSSAQQFGGANQSAQAAAAREAYRGRTQTGVNQGTRDGAPANRPGAGANPSPRPAPPNNNSPAPNRGAAPAQIPSSPSRGNAFDGAAGNGSAARSDSQRGRSSRGGAGGAGGGGGGGGARGGGGGGGGRR